MTENGKPSFLKEDKHSSAAHSKSLSVSEEKIPQCPSASSLAHLAILRLANAGIISKVLAAVSHLGVELVDHFVENSDSDLEFDADLSDEDN